MSLMDGVVKASDVFIVQSTLPPADNFMELLLMIDAARRASAENVNVIIPILAMPGSTVKTSPGVAICGQTHRQPHEHRGRQPGDDL